MVFSFWIFFCGGCVSSCCISGCCCGGGVSGCGGCCGGGISGCCGGGCVSRGCCSC